MIPLTAREALSPQVERVTATMRPSELGERERGSGPYAVFGEEDGAFLGLATEHTCARFPHRIFADLSAEPRPVPVAAETPIEAVHHRMAAEGVEPLPVLDENGAFLGVITRPSLLEALLRRERELLADAQCLQGQLEAEQKRLVAQSKRQEELNQASHILLGLVGQTALERELLQEAIHALGTLLQARYGAMGILDEADGRQQFLFTGLTPEEVNRIGAHPQGLGLLGVIIREDQILRLADLTQDPRHAGFPPYHPPMKTLLAVPISHQGAVYGRVYLCDKTTGEPFTEDDERLTISFARSLALALAHARELAERKRAEEVLRTTHARLEFLLSSTPAVIYTCKPSGDYGATFISENVTSELGHEPREFTEESAFWAKHIHPEDAPRVFAELTRLFEQGHHSHEYRFLHKDGMYRWMRDELRLVRDAAGSPLEIVGYWIDITERKRTEEMLQEMNVALANAMPGISRLDPGGRYVDVNEAYARMIGYEPGEMIGIDWALTVHPDDRRNAITAHHRMFSEGKAEFEARAVRKDGSVFHKHVLMVKRVDKGGNFIGQHCFMRDVTERKLAEATQRSSEDRYRALYDDNPIMYFTVDTAGTVLSVNEYGAAQLGYRVEELQGQSVLKVVHEDDRRVVGQRLMAYIQQPTPLAQWEFRKVRKDGTVLWVKELARAVQAPDGRPVVLLVCEDITERKRAEETLQALYRASLAIQEPLGLQERLDHLLQTAREVLHLDRLSIMLADNEDRWLEGVAALGITHPAKEMRVPIGPEGGGLAQAYLTQQPIIWVDSQTPVPEQIRLQPPYNRLEAFRSKAFALLPMAVQGRAIGVIAADRKLSRQPIEPTLLPLLQLFAAQAAVAIHQAQLFEQIQAGRARLQSLSNRLLAVQEGERRHLARELHDEIGQILTGLKLTLEMGARSCPVEVKPCLGGALALVNELMGRVRDLSLDLRPAMLDDLGLIPALLWHFERYTAQTGVRVDFSHTGPEKRFPPEVETAAYRIVQEALTNVARHAGVGGVTVRLWSDSSLVGVEIQDRGVGFNPEAALAAGATSGLAGMHERATLLGGHLTVNSTPGEGTLVAAELPLTDRIDTQKKSR